MTPKMLWLIVGLLGATCAGQGYYIHRVLEKDRAAGADFRKDIPFRSLEELFDDEFFARPFAPFAPLPQQPLFDRLLREGLNPSPGGATVRPEIERTDDEVVLRLKVPGAEGESLKVDVEGEQIRIAYDARTVREDRDKRGGRASRSESVRSVQTVFPVPEDADPDTSRVEKDEEGVRIVFDKRKERPSGRKA